MKFTVQTVVTNVSNCKMRLGQFSEINRLPNTILLTPLLLLYTKGGSVTHLTREVLEMVTDVSVEAIQVPLANSFQCYNGLKQFKEGISSFAGLTECLSYCTVQDPAELTRTGYNDKLSTTVWTHVGRKQLTPDTYMDMMEAFRPDMYQALCDGDTDKSSSHKRLQKAVMVSNNMLDTCADRHTKSQSLQGSMLLGVVEGGYDLGLRREAASSLSRHPQLQGYVIDGLHNNGQAVEQMTYAGIQPIITETLKQLPEGRLRVVHGAWQPEVVLELVHAGVDVLDSSLVFLTTERGCAFTFTYSVLQSSKEGTLSNGCHSKDEEEPTQPSVDGTCDGAKKTTKPVNNYEMNLTDKKYAEDFAPLVADCQCLTCVKHTRAYIYHLINTKEMLASVLLMIHNLHHYLQFFRAIREHGSRGELLTIDPPIS